MSGCYFLGRFNFSTFFGSDQFKNRIFSLYTIYVITITCIAYLHFAVHSLFEAQVILLIGNLKNHRCFRRMYSDRTVSVWEWRSGSGFVEKSYSPLSHHKYMVTSVHFDGDATVLASSSLDGNTTLSDVKVSSKPCGEKNCVYVGVQVNCVKMSFARKIVRNLQL